MSGLSEQVGGLKRTVASLKTRVTAITPNDIIYSALGEYVIYGCLVTEGDDATDQTVKLEGQASGDSDHHNPDFQTDPSRGYQYANIASGKDGAFRSQDVTADVDDPPATGTARYDIAYVFVGPGGSGFSIQEGSPSSSIKTDFDSNGLDTTEYGSSHDPSLPVGALPVARIYVEDDVTGIPDSRIADIRDFEGRLASVVDQQFASPPELGSDTPNTVNATDITATGSATITGNVNTQGVFQTNGTQIDTDDVLEGNNLFYTDERVDDRVNTLIQDGTGISWSYDDGAGTLTGTVTLSPFSTSDLSEGTNLYYTNERVDDRVNNLLSAGSGINLSYDDAANSLTITNTGGTSVEGQFSGAEATRDTTTSVANNTATIIPWDGELFDTDDYHESATNPSRLTVPNAGKYLIGGTIEFAAWSSLSDGRLQVRLFKNGSFIRELIDNEVDSSGGDGPSYSFQTVVDAAANDYFELNVIQASGGSRDITTNSVFYAARLQGSGPSQLADLNDVTSINYTDGRVLRANGSEYVSATLNTSDLNNDDNYAKTDITQTFTAAQTFNTDVSMGTNLIVGDTTVTPDGTLHVHTGSAGNVTASSSAENLIVEDGPVAGISILGSSRTNLVFGSGVSNFRSYFQWDENSREFRIVTFADDPIKFSTNNTNALTLDSSQNANIVSGALQMGGTEVIDSSRNATFNALNGNVTSTGSTTARNLKDRFADVVNVKDFGAVGDGSTDDTSAFQSFASHLNSNAPIAGYIPQGHYIITEPFVLLSEVDLYGDGFSSWIDNTSTGSGTTFWNNTCVILGTYFSFGAQDGADQETAYTLDAITAPTREVTTSTASDAGNFAEGDIVFITDGSLINSTWPLISHCNRVVSADSGTGVIVLDYAIQDDYSSGSNSVEIRKATGSLTIDSTRQFQGETNAKIAEKSKIRNLRFSQAATLDNGQCIHIAGYECELSDLFLDGVSSGFGINPSGHCRYSRIYGRILSKFVEQAYFGNNNLWEMISSTRIGDGGGSNDIPFAFSESGVDNRLSNFIFTDYSFTGDAGTATLSLGTRRCHAENGAIHGAQGNGVTIIGSSSDDRAIDTVVRDVMVANPASNGINVGSNGCVVEGNKILGTPSGQIAINPSSYLSSFTIRNNELGRPSSKTTGDVIVFTGTVTEETVIENNRGQQTHHSAVNNNDESHSGTTSATELRSITFGADETSRRAGWHIKSSGNVTGTNGAKTVKLRWGTPGSLSDAITITIDAATNSGLWEIEAVLIKHSNTEQYLSYRVIDPDDSTAVQSGFALNGVNMLNNQFKVALEFTLADSGDTLNVREWQVKSFNDQFDDIT